MDCASIIDGEPEYQQIKDYVEFEPDTKITPQTETTLNSMYYHSAKRTLVNSKYTRRRFKTPNPRNNS